MKNKINIIGAGGHARALISLLEHNNFKVSGIFDDTYSKSSKEGICGYKIIGKIRDAQKSLNRKFILAVGDNLERKELLSIFLSKLLRENVIHPRAIIEKGVVMGICNQIFTNVSIGTGVILGDNNIINTGAIIEHESSLGCHNHLSVGAIVCGRASVGDNCFIGAGSVIIDKVRVCDNSIIGANTTVIEDIKTPGTYVGSPARKVR